MSIIIADIAGTGSGKTQRSIQVSSQPEFNGMRKMVVDPEKEYILEKQFDQIDPKCDIVKLLQQDWLVNTFLIIDCANYKFPTRNITDDRKLILAEALGGARHNGNVIYLNFHALAQVPPYIRFYIDRMTLGHTNDSRDILRGYGYKEAKLKSVFDWLQERIHKPHACDTF